MSQLPKGITEVRWKNKDQRKSEIRYRVRINRKDIKVDQLFDNLEQAKEYVRTASSQAGRALLVEQQKEAMVQAVFETLSNQNLMHYVQTYIQHYIQKDPKTMTATQKRSMGININRLNTILATKVPYTPENIKKMTGFYELNTSLHKHFRDGGADVGLKPLGEFPIFEVDQVVATDYIRERLKVASKPTVRREVGQMQTFFNKLKYFAKSTSDLIAKNPFENADKSLLKGHNRKRKRRLATNEEDKLFLHLAGMRNPAMLQIVALALATGMRRSEVLFLQWDYLRDGYIELPEDVTKAGEERRVFLSSEAQQIIGTIKKVEGQKRLFKYTIDGFKTNFYRAVKACGIENLRFHDLRREHISRMVLALNNPNAALIGELIGMKSARHLQEEYIEPTLDSARVGISDTKGLMQSVGHKKIGMLAHYTNILDTKTK